MIQKTNIFLSVLFLSMVIGLIGFFIVPESYGSFSGLDRAWGRNVKIYHDIDKPTILEAVNNRITVRVGARASKMPLQKRRLPLNLAIVLDKSGSMSGQNKIENAKQGAIEMISRLNKDDFISIITFDSRAHVLVPVQRVRNKRMLIRKVRSIRANGGTALYDGVSVAAQEMRRRSNSDYLNRMVLLSDGMANVGPQTNAEIFRLGEGIFSDDMQISAIGLGLEFNEQLLSELTANSGGSYYYANNSDELPSIFKKEIEQTISVVAKNMRIRVYAQNGTRSLGAIGPANREEEYMVETWIPFMYGGDDKYRLIELEVPPTWERTVQAGYIEIEYWDPFAEQLVNENIPLILDISSNKKLVERRINKDVIKDAYIRRSAEYKEMAMEYSRSGNYDRASKILMDSSRELENAAVICDNDKDLFRESRSNQNMSTNVRSNRGFTNNLMKSSILNTSQEFWGN